LARREGFVPARIDSLRKDFASLSNFFVSLMRFEGEVFPTVDDVFQAAKTFDLEERANVRDPKTPGSAKKIGRRVKLRPDLCGPSLATQCCGSSSSTRATQSLWGQGVDRKARW
jgi:hypothetical protein